MKDLKIGDVVVTKALKTGDDIYDMEMEKQNGLGKIINIYNTRKGTIYTVKTGENTTKSYLEEELEIAIKDLCEEDKEKIKNTLDLIDSTKDTERTRKFLGTNIKLQESEMERKAAMNNVDVKVINDKKEYIEEEKIRENKGQEDFSNTYVKKVYEIDERLVRNKGYVLIKDRDKENKLLIALVQDVNKSSIRLVYVKDEDKEIEQIELTAKEFAEIVA